MSYCYDNRRRKWFARSTLRMLWRVLFVNHDNNMIVTVIISRRHTVGGLTILYTFEGGWYCDVGPRSVRLGSRTLPRDPGNVTIRIGRLRTNVTTDVYNGACVRRTDTRTDHVAVVQVNRWSPPTRFRVATGLSAGMAKRNVRLEIEQKHLLGNENSGRLNTLSYGPKNMINGNVDKLRASGNCRLRG